MPMIRTVHNQENQFVQLNKKALWDKDLSLEAVGLWARLLSRPDDWEVSVAELSKSCGVSPHKIYRILKELIKAGYAHRCQEKIDSSKSTKKKVFSPWMTYVFEFKVTKEEIQKMFPLGTFPHADNPLSGKRHTTNTNKVSNSSIEELETNKEATQTPPNPQRGDEPEGSGQCVAFGRFVRLRHEEFEGLVREHGEKYITELIDDMNDEISDSGKIRNDYAAALRKWIRYRKSKSKNKDLSAGQEENFRKNEALVKELVKDHKKFSGLNFYYKAHLLKDSNCEDFSVSALIDHRSFCRVLDKRFKSKIEKVVFGASEAKHE